MRKITKIEKRNLQLPTRKKVAAYARVSKDTERLMNSVSAQVSYYSSLIQNNPEWEYAGVYVDSGITGTLASKRSDYQRLLDDCEEGKIDIILTKSISRFARNTVDLLEAVRHLKSIGIEVRFEKEKINTFSEDGELMLTLLASFAQEESRSISENSKWGIRKRFQSGEIGVCNKHLLGYQYDEEQRKYIIIPDEAESVRWMFQMFIDGLSYRMIAKKLNDAGVRSVLGNEFQEATVRQLILNEVYAGDTLRQKCYIADPIQKNKVKNQGELPQYYIQDSHEAIIDRETYELVQAEIQRRATLQNDTYCFTGKMHCEICGANYSRHKNITKYNTYVRWMCRSKKEKGMSCTSANYKEEELKQISAEMLGMDSFDEDIFDEKVRDILVRKNGDLEFQLIGGETKIWVKPPQVPKVPKPKPQSSRPRNIFDGKIICGKCGRRFGRAMSQTNDGGHLYWRCRSKARVDATCDSVNYTDAEIRKIFCRVFEQKSFKDDYFTKTIDYMEVRETGSIDFYLKDGSVKSFETFKLRINYHENTSTDEFTGKVICADCGNEYRRYICGGEYAYWKCAGKTKVRTECHSREISDCNLRMISAYIMGTDGFDADAFSKQIRNIEVQKDGSLTYHYHEGSDRTWEKV